MDKWVHICKKNKTYFQVIQINCTFNATLFFIRTDVTIIDIIEPDLVWGI